MIMKIQQTNLVKFIKRLSLVLKVTVSVLLELSEKNLMNRIAVCSSNLARYKRELFLNRFITGDTKWIVFKNVVKKSLCV